MAPVLIKWPLLRPRRSVIDLIPVDPQRRSAHVAPRRVDGIPSPRSGSSSQEIPTERLDEYRTYADGGDLVNWIQSAAGACRYGVRGAWSVLKGLLHLLH